MNRLLTVGVLGGMGPAATVDFMARVLAITAAPREQDNLRLIVDCNPHVPDRNTAGQDGTDPGAVLASMAKGLEVAGADFVVMACNTAHAYEADIRAALSVPFVSLITETAAVLKAAHPGVHRAGLLAGTGCLEARLYQNAFSAIGVDAVRLSSADQAHFMDLLYRIKRGDTGPAVRTGMARLAQTLADTGAEVVVAACTEAPLVLSQLDVARPLIDTTAILAARTVAYARDGEPLPLR